MKATLLTSAIALCALTALAAQQQAPAPAEQTAATTTSTVEQKTLSVTTAASGSTDSPLVAAAKRTGRLGKKPSNVITNDTLSKTGGHFTTTKSQDPIPESKAAMAGAAAAANGASGATNAPITTNNTPTPATPAKAAPQTKKDSDKSDAQKSAVVKRAVADYMGDSVENVSEDPATQEGVVSAGTAPKPAAKPAAPRPPVE